ncbi:hypothetical protein BY458DRAFT_523120 [Sporodiniella umbellata]|nr:hypothetical protein BY458DRAFT_523120 [Sporodiniella umbellata]
MKDTPFIPTFLSEYSEIVEVLPLELQRNYKLIRQLDENTQQLMTQVAHETVAITQQEGKLLADEKRKKLKSIRQLLETVIQKGEEKYALAQATYDSVDRHCAKLDQDLQKIEDEQMVGTTRGLDKTTREEKEVKRKKGEESQTNTPDTLQSSISFSQMPIDPNEPRYCYCQRVSFGEMMACDNIECDIEWFHLECTDLEAAPEGAWFCKHCAPSNANKKKRKL